MAATTSTSTSSADQAILTAANALCFVAWAAETLNSIGWDGNHPEYAKHHGLLVSSWEGVQRVQGDKNPELMPLIYAARKGDTARFFRDYRYIVGRYSQA